MFAACRWLHVYLSSALLGLLVFFCFTGILLNHLDWFEGEGSHAVERDTLPADIIETYRRDPKQSISELEKFIAERWKLRHPRKVDLDFEMGEIMFDFPMPAGYAMVSFYMEEGTVALERQNGTMLALLNDLHKGRHTGFHWSLVIDGSAILIILLSVTGLVILLQTVRMRLPGLILAFLGLLGPFLIYFVWVPR